MNEEKSISASIVPVVVGELVNAARESPDMKIAGANTAASLKIISTTIKNALIPFAVFNFAVGKAEDYFRNQFEEDLSEKASKIPPEFVVEPKASVAGPTIVGLTYSHEEAPLKDMYLELLTAAMDSRSSENVHPAFVEIIRQLSAEEAQLLRAVLRTVGLLAVGEIQLTIAEGTRTLHRNLINFLSGGVADVNPRIPSFIDNWLRLGLIDISYDRTLNNEQAYIKLEQRPEFLNAVTDNPDGKVKLSRGSLTQTDFGIRFAAAIAVIASPNQLPKI